MATQSAERGVLSPECLSEVLRKLAFTRNALLRCNCLTKM